MVLTLFGPPLGAGLCLNAVNRLDHLIVSLAPRAPMYTYSLLVGLL